MKKLIKSFNLLDSDLIASSSSRNFSINGDNGSVFDLKITNAAGQYYSFEKQVFSTAQTITTTASSVGTTIDSTSFVILTANANIIPGMLVTGNGIDIETKVLSLSNNNFVVNIDQLVSIPHGSTITFKAVTGLQEQVLTNGSYNGSIVFPTVTGNDTYSIELQALAYYDTFLEAQEVEFDMNPNSVTFGDQITSGFRDNLYKTITINQYINTVATFNMSSTDLTSLDVDFSANTFNISKYRNYSSLNTESATTSFSWPIEVPDSSAIVKSLTLIADYFETLETQTVNGAVSGGRVIVLDSVDNIVESMKISAVSSGSLSGSPVVLKVDAIKKTIILSITQTFADGITLTFKALSALGPSAYGSQVSFQNLSLVLEPLTVVVAAASDNSTALSLVNAAGIQDGGNTIIKGVGIDVDNTEVNIATRAASFTEGGAVYNNDPTIAHTADERIVVGLAVSGTGIPAGATIASITDETHFELSVSTTGGGVAAGTLTFNSNDVTLSSARTLEAGAVLTLEGTGKTATITGDVVLTNMGLSNFTSTLNIDNFIKIGVI